MTTISGPTSASRPSALPSPKIEYAGRRVPLNVSAGLGTSIYAPVRFAVRPEVSLLTLEARA